METVFNTLPINECLLTTLGIVVSAQHVQLNNKIMGHVFMGKYTNWHIRIKKSSQQ